jgi:hypothetical protein
LWLLLFRSIRFPQLAQLIYSFGFSLRLRSCAFLLCCFFTSFEHSEQYRWFVCFRSISRPQHSQRIISGCFSTFSRSLACLTRSLTSLLVRSFAQAGQNFCAGAFLWVTCPQVAQTRSAIFRPPDGDPVADELVHRPAEIRLPAVLAGHFAQQLRR